MLPIILIDLRTHHVEVVAEALLRHHLNKSRREYIHDPVRVGLHGLELGLWSVLLDSHLRALPP
jgi:hypothetical protein